MSGTQSADAVEVSDQDVVVVGAGFAGLYAIHRFRGLGMRLVAFEAGDDVGGTWYWNRYPGARCDVESVDYSYSFDPELEQEFTWTERYAAQPEILEYLRLVARRHDLYRSIRFGRRVRSARFGDDGRWRVRTDRGDEVSARYLVLGTGPLSEPLIPALPGLDSFGGQMLSTSRWPAEGADLVGKRVAVVGTGSSGIQAIPVIAGVAAQVTVFQRTANFSIPAQNRPLAETEMAKVKRTYRERRARARTTANGSPHIYRSDSALDVAPDERQAVFEAAWLRGGTHFTKAFGDVTRDERANELAVRFVHEKIRAIVADPQMAADLMPTGHPLGSKRICADTGYYETYNRANVSLVNLQRTPIVAVTTDGIRTIDGDRLIDHATDVIVLATGFDAMTGSFTAIDVRGPDTGSLQDAWADGPRTYLGLMTSGFPNLFFLCGPGSPSVLANVVAAGEQQVEWLTDLFGWAQRGGTTCIEAESEAEADWGRQVAAAATGTLFPRANSWYLGSNVPGKPRVFLPYVGGLDRYRAMCDEVARAGYSGFVVS
jgi:cation diffusion facilitator CzcD-associated flavoprotein CzcO